jgi:hypothetical protein
MDHGLSGLDGLIDEQIGDVLYGYAREVLTEHTIVELGSYRGMSTCYLAAGARDGREAQVYAVDTWSEDVSDWRASVKDYLPSPLYSDFESQLRKQRLWSRVTPVIQRSAEAGGTYRGRKVGLLYIDADHHYAAVMADFKAWHRHCAREAVVIFDDYDTRTNPGVTRAVHELAEKGHIKGLRKEAGRLAVAHL